LTLTVLTILDQITIVASKLSLLSGVLILYDSEP